jgi:LPXTG-site transpeptidase (sortase) family protein
MFRMKMNKNDHLIIILTTLLIFALIYAVVSALGFLPKQYDYVDLKKEDKNEFLADIDTKILYPEKISIPKIEVESIIQRPGSIDINVLDQALERGAVYYPGSGTINVGNIFIFGHSADRYVGVTNPAYKVFNSINKLVPGDEILIESNGKNYVYEVQNLKLVDESTAYVDFTKTSKMLTISTCNTFGKTEERWVVEAIYSGEREIPQV